MIVFMCMCVHYVLFCEYIREVFILTHTYTHTHTHINIHTEFIQLWSITLMLLPAKYITY